MLLEFRSPISWARNFLVELEEILVSGEYIQSYIFLIITIEINKSIIIFMIIESIIYYLVRVTSLNGLR